MNKLTNAQRKALEIAADRDSVGISSFDAKPATISALNIDGLITAYSIPGGGVRYRISDEGRQALASTEETVNEEMKMELTQITEEVLTEIEADGGKNYSRLVMSLIAEIRRLQAAVHVTVQDTTLTEYDEGAGVWIAPANEAPAVASEPTATVPTYKHNNFGKVQKMHDGFQAMWYTDTANMQTRAGFTTRKEANDFLKANGITVMAWKDFNRRCQFRV